MSVDELYMLIRRTVGAILPTISSLDSLLRRHQLLELLVPRTTIDFPSAEGNVQTRIGNSSSPFLNTLTAQSIPPNVLPR